MASNKTSSNKKSGMPQKTVDADGTRAVDVYFAKYAESHQNSTNELIHFICIPLIVFSLLGLVWSIPFPSLSFLGAYNGVFNWASFLIAFSIYYYLKLSPMLSYLMLFILFGFSYAIIGIEHWHKTGGPALWQVSLIIFLISWVGQFIGHKIEGKKPSFLDDIKFLLIGPIYLLHLVLKKLSIKY
jgi:uncharacterized membrane protein YGL010W